MYNEYEQTVTTVCTYHTIFSDFLITYTSGWNERKVRAVFVNKVVTAVYQVYILEFLHPYLVHRCFRVEKIINGNKRKVGSVGFVNMFFL